MKYIDAERLRAEIEKRLKNTRDYMNGAGMKYKGPKFYKAQGKESAYDALLNIIDSLQQEQPSEDLQKAAEEFASDYPFDNNDQAIAEYSFKVGAQWQKEQMMKEAVETTMVEGSLSNPTFVKRKIIIVKED